ncbi:MAG: hypothetical protein HFI33_14045 [Lachnospiraceae bacterium]|nr:hypothetical protein [Lachnospiraceae bacterium]
MAVYLAIDLGTTGCRSILFDGSLRQIADSYQEYGLFTPRDGWVEQDAKLWWKLTLETAKRVMEKAGISGNEIRGISVSSQGITLVPVDESLTPLCNALSWLDVRASEEARQLERDLGFRWMFTMTGKPIDPAYFLPKVLWLKKHEPEICQRTWKYLMPMDFLIGKLTGRCVTDHSMASGTLLYDIKNATWCGEILEKYGISEEQLPELSWSGKAVGKVLPQVARELGLREDCIVGVGAQDQKSAALGVGLTEGVMTISLGTSGAISRYWTEAKTQGDTRVGWCGYVFPRTWVTEGVINTAAATLRWLRDVMFPGADYEVMNQEARAAQERGSTLFCYPYLNGPSSPDNYPDSQGCFYGVHLGTGRGDFALAVMEGVAFQVRILLEAMDAGTGVHTLVLFGGASKSPLWCQIIADVTGKKIRVLETAEAAGAGAAVLAGMAAGDFLVNALPCVACSQEYAPGELLGAYEEKYQEYRRLEYKLWR